MDEKKWLTIGDTVDVYFEHVQKIRGRIISMSEEGSDLEYAIKESSGKIHQVRNYCLMSET